MLHRARSGDREVFRRRWESVAAPVKLAIGVVALALVPAIAFLGGLAPASGEAAGEFVASHSGQCLTPDRSAPANNARIMQLPCDDQADQQFQLRDVGAGRVEIFNEATGLCFHVENHVGTDGAPFLQTWCNPESLNSVFETRPSSGGTVFVVQHTGMCLEVTGASRDGGALAGQGACTDEAHQVFGLGSADTDPGTTTTSILVVDPDSGSTTTTVGGNGGQGPTDPDVSDPPGDTSAPAGFAAIPRPDSVRFESGTLAVSTANRVVFDDPQLRRLAEVHTADIERVLGVRLADPTGAANGGSGDITLGLRSDLSGEAYEIRVDGSGVAISAGNYDALAFAMMTALQSYGTDGSGLVIRHLAIADQPDVPYRAYQFTIKVNGDVSSANYLGLDQLKRHIDLARMYKVRYVQIHTTESQWMLATLDQSNSVPDGVLRANNLYSKAQWDELIAYGAERGVHLQPHNESTPGFDGMRRALVDNGGTGLDLVAELYRQAGVSLGGGRDGRIGAAGGGVDAGDPDYATAMEWFTRLSYRQFAAGHADGKVPIYHMGPVFGEGGTSPAEMEKILSYLRSEDGDVKLMFWGGPSPDDPIVQRNRDDIVVALYSPNDFHQPMQAHLDAGLTVLNAAWRPHYITPREQMTPDHVYENSNRFREGNDGIARPLEYLQANPSDRVIGGLISQWDFSRLDQGQLDSALPRVAPWADRYWNFEPFSQYRSDDYERMAQTFEASERMTRRLLGLAGGGSPPLVPSPPTTVPAPPTTNPPTTVQPPAPEPPTEPPTTVQPPTPEPPNTPGPSQATFHGVKPFQSFGDGVIDQDAWTRGDIAFYAPRGRVDQATAERWLDWYVRVDDLYREVSARPDFDRVYRADDANFGRKKVLAIIDDPDNTCGTVKAAGCGSKQQAQAALGYVDDMTANPSDWSQHWIFFYEMGRGGSPERFAGRGVWPAQTLIMPHLMAGLAFHEFGGDAGLEKGIPGHLLDGLDEWERRDAEFVDVYASDLSHDILVAMLYRILQDTDKETVVQIVRNLEQLPTATQPVQAMCGWQQAVNDATGGRFSARMKGEWGLPHNC